MKDRLKGPIANRELLIGISTGVLLASSMRVFVAGAYSSVEKTFFYNVMFPSVLGVVLFIIASAVVGKLNRRIGAAIVAAYALVSLLTDATEYTHLIAALAIPVALALLSELDIKYVTMGLVADLGLRVLAVGGEPLDFPHTRIILSLVVLFGAYALWKDEGKLPKPGFGLYAFAALLELGLMYPNAVLRYSGINSYYLPTFVGYSFIIALALLGGPYLARKPKIAPVLLILGTATLFVKPLSLIGLPLALTSAVALVESAKTIRKGELGAIYLFLVVTLALGAYIGRDIGLAFMEDKLEALIVVASIVYAVVTYGKNAPISTPNRKEVVSVLAGLALVSVIVLALFNTGPSYAESKKDVLIWSYNIHQGFGPYRGTFNGYELVKLLREHEPDIIASQEVVGGMIANGYQDVPLMLSAYLGYAYEYKPAVEGTYGIAIFSHWRMNTEGELNLKSVGQARPAQKVMIEELE